MLAGRKLLLADDSITIQKVVALTFADEGVEVVTVSNGHEAIEQLKKSAPDIVLADLFMPEVNGYEVCRYVKQNAKLKHIPVMLLVGSFEPFDEAEARRAGADDILTKPFQSIRRLIDKVGGLVGGKPADEAATAELPHVEEAAPEPERLSTEELQISTADTLRLPDYPTYEPAAPVSQSDFRSYEPIVETQPSNDLNQPPNLREEYFQESQIMDSPSNKLPNESIPDSGDVLLDLGDISRPSVAASDDFVLDLDFDEPQSSSAVEAASVSRSTSFVESRSQRAMEIAQAENPQSTAWMDTSELAHRHHGLPPKEAAPSKDQKFVDTQEWKRGSATSASGDLKRARQEQGDTAPRGPVSLDQLSPEVIDAIAHRVVEQLSARVVEEIAWEVVPQLAELMIKRRLEEKESQRK